MIRRLAILASALLWTAAAFAAEPDGFGTLRWGAPPPDTWQQRQPVGSFIHSARGRAAVYGKVPLERVNYEFGGGELVRVALVFEGHQAYEGLRAQLEEDYGRPGEPAAAAPATEALQWKGQTTDAYLGFVWEGAPGLLLLCRAPSAAPPEAGSMARKRDALVNRIRIYDLLDGALEKSQAAIESHIAWLDKALQIDPTDRHPCRGLTVDGEQDQQLQQRGREEWLMERENVSRARKRLREEAEAVQAELTAMR